MSVDGPTTFCTSTSASTQATENTPYIKADRPEWWESHGGVVDGLGTISCHYPALCESTSNLSWRQICFFPVARWDQFREDPWCTFSQGPVGRRTCRQEIEQHALILCLLCTFSFFLSFFLFDCQFIGACTTFSFQYMYLFCESNLINNPVRWTMDDFRPLLQSRNSQPYRDSMAFRRLLTTDTTWKSHDLDNVRHNYLHLHPLFSFLINGI